MRALVTGASGFAGGHLAAACAAAGDDVVRVSRSGEVAVDLTDGDATRAAIAETRPGAVYHLAALASVGRSWSDPATTIQANTLMTINLLEAVRAEAPEAVVLIASSGEIYGPPRALPVDESAPLAPQNPYAVSKATSDLLGGFYADAHDLRVVRARAFNHSGPGQKPVFAIGSFARQVAEGLEAGDEPIRVVTGNPEARRDYTDVRDVVDAYRRLAASAPAGTYNVCSGRTASAAELVQALRAVAGVEIEHVVDPALVRRHEVMEVRGSYERLHEATGWRPTRSLETTLADAVRWWREELRAGRASPALHE